jgi:hypothetical protein
LEKTTTIQITERTKSELLKVKGELLSQDGINRTFDDLIQELLYYWTKGTKKTGYRKL